jgi:hypothetical protein
MFGMRVDSERGAPLLVLLGALEGLAIPSIPHDIP